MENLTITEKSAETLRALAKDITDNVENMKTKTAELRNSLGKYRDILETHEDYLSLTLDMIDEKIGEASRPAGEIHCKLNEFANILEEIIKGKTGPLKPPNEN